MNTNTRTAMAIFASTLCAMVMLGCVPKKTTHEIKSQHELKIVADININIRQIKDDAQSIEGYVEGTSNEEPEVAQAGKSRDIFAEDLTPAERERRRVLAAGAAAVQARKARAEQIDEALKFGMIGLNERGYYEVLNLDDQGGDVAKSLVDDENSDLAAIYKATLANNNHDPEDPEKLEAVELAYAEIKRERLPVGAQYRAPSDPERLDEFKKTSLGQQYPGAQPGQWLTK